MKKAFKIVMVLALTLSLAGGSPAVKSTTAVGPDDYAEGSVVDSTATPASEWQFDGRTGDVADVNSPATTVTEDSGETVTADFSQTMHTLTMAVTGSGSTSPAVGPDDYAEGSVVDGTATPASGWQFDDRTGDVADVDSPATTVTEDSGETVTASFSQTMNTQTMVVTGSGPTTSAVAISVEVDPAPPDYVVNDGTMSQGFRWTIDFDSTPDHYTFEVRRVSGNTLVAGTDITVDISSESSPGTVHNPEWAGYHTWAVPLGQAAGSYIARVEYWSEVGYEQGGEQVFYVNDKAHLTAVITTPADDSTHNVSTDFTVSATISNSGDSQANSTFAELTIDAHASVVAGANPQPLGVIPAGEFAVATWTVHCDSEGDSVLTVIPSGSDGTSGEPIPGDNIDEASITVHQEDLRGTLIVFKYEDLNGNGDWDQGEPGLEGWEFDVTGPESFPGELTDGNGLITLSDILIGGYTITETLQGGWVNTEPGGDPPYQQPAAVTTDGSIQVDFGNQRTPSPGCTRTFGYWKTHSDHGPAPYDVNWVNVTPNGADSLFFDTGETWYQVLWTPPKRGNAYFILAHQYIAAYLNQLNGASVPPEVASALSHAADLLGQYDGNPDEMDQIKGTVREDFISTAELLDDYNNGDIGPGHCPG